MKFNQRRRTIATMATVAACATTLLLGGAASAQISEDLVPPVLDMIDDVTGITPTPLPTEKNGEVVGGIDRPVRDTIDDALGALDQGPGGGGEPGPSPSNAPGGNDDQNDGDGDPSSDDGTGPSATGGSDQGGTGGSGGASSSGSSALGEATEASASYSSTSARAALATATRAIRLAGPLSAPLLFGVLAVVVLIGLGRGSEGLLKIERAREAGRVYRL